MPGKPREFEYGYRDIQRATGLDLDTLYQHKVRANLDPQDLISVVKFIARHGTLKLRREIIDYMLSRELTEKPGEPKKHRRRKRSG